MFIVRIIILFFNSTDERYTVDESQQETQVISTSERADSDKKDETSDVDRNIAVEENAKKGIRIILYSNDATVIFDKSTSLGD